MFQCCCVTPNPYRNGRGADHPKSCLTVLTGSDRPEQRPHFTQVLPDRLALLDRLAGAHPMAKAAVALTLGSPAPWGAAVHVTAGLSLRCRALARRSAPILAAINSRRCIAGILLPGARPPARYLAPRRAGCSCSIYGARAGGRAHEAERVACSLGGRCSGFSSPGEIGSAVVRSWYRRAASQTCVR